MVRRLKKDDKTYEKMRRERDREKRLAFGRAYYRKNRARLLEQKRLHRIANIDIYIARDRKRSKKKTRKLNRMGLNAKGKPLVPKWEIKRFARQQLSLYIRSLTPAQYKAHQRRASRIAWKKKTPEQREAHMQMLMAHRDRTHLLRKRAKKLLGNMASAF